MEHIRSWQKVRIPQISPLASPKSVALAFSSPSNVGMLFVLEKLLKLALPLLAASTIGWSSVVPSAELIVAERIEGLDRRR